MNADRKLSESTVWNTTIENIAKRFGTISASSSVKESPELAKKRRSTQVSLAENCTWKSKEKSLSEEPLGLDGLRKVDERRSREPVSEAVTPTRHPMERRSCRLRFKSPSDNSQCNEKTNLHLASLVRSNKEKIQSHLKIGRPIVPLKTTVVSPLSEPPKVQKLSTSVSSPRIVANLSFRQLRVTEDSPQQNKRQALKRRARSD